MLTRPSEESKRKPLGLLGRTICANNKVCSLTSDHILADNLILTPIGNKCGELLLPPLKIIHVIK